MYFKPAEKNYYRFPSSNSVDYLDSRYYFPEKTHATGDDTLFEARAMNHESKYDSFKDD